VSDEIPEAARWHGSPNRIILRAIFAHTYVDQQGRRYYRQSPTDGWRRLRSAEEFAELNAVIEKYRERA
jgi:hypothetical protein